MREFCVVKRENEAEGRGDFVDPEALGFVDVDKNMLSFPRAKKGQAQGKRGCYICGTGGDLYDRCRAHRAIH